MELLILSYGSRTSEIADIYNEAWDYGGMYLPYSLCNFQNTRKQD